MMARAEGSEEGKNSERQRKSGKPTQILIMSLRTELSYCYDSFHTRLVIAQSCTAVAVCRLALLDSP